MNGREGQYEVVNLGSAVAVWRALTVYLVIPHIAPATRTSLQYDTSRYVVTIRILYI